MPPIKFKLNQTYHSGADVIWSILAILNLHAATMPSTKFPLHPTLFGSNNNWRLQDGRHGGHLEYNSDGDV